MKKPRLILVVIGAAIFFVVAAIIVLIGPKSSSNTQQSTSYKGVEIVPDLRKDSIPALTNPQYESGSSSLTWIQKEDLVIGVNLNGDVRAYPVKILSWHEIVNETIGGEDVAVTYSPLCASAVVFDRTVDGQKLNFGNTGALYESCSVMYDTQSNSYWWQVTGQSIRGEKIDKTMTIMPSALTTWGEWYEANPNTQVLSIDTGISRDYTIDPYQDYYELENSAFPVSVNDDRLKTKERVVGIEVNGKHKAYAFADAKDGAINDEFEGQDVRIIGSADGRTAQAYFASGNQQTLAPQTSAFWFAWSTAHPETELYKK
jgi:hypothetical protein